MGTEGTHFEGTKHVGYGLIGRSGSSIEAVNLGNHSFCKARRDTLWLGGFKLEKIITQPETQ